VKTKRLVIFLAGNPSRLITINCKLALFYHLRLQIFVRSNLLTFKIVTNKKYEIQLGRRSDGRVSPIHATVTPGSGSYEIGNFLSTNGCPGIPLDPAVLASKENCRVNWLELEFRDPTGNVLLLRSVEVGLG
jgi:hypothetical protein